MGAMVLQRLALHAPPPRPPPPPVLDISFIPHVIGKSNLDLRWVSWIYVRYCAMVQIYLEKFVTCQSLHRYLHVSLLMFRFINKIFGFLSFFVLNRKTVEQFTSPINSTSTDERSVLTLLDTLNYWFVKSWPFHLFDVFDVKFKRQQESPPAWTQEAYRPPCSEYSFCCPTWVPPPGGYPVRYPPGGGSGYPPGGGYPVRYPPGGVPGQVPPGSGYPPGGGPGQVPPGSGYPPGGVPGQVPPPLPHGILGNVAKHYGIWVPPPGVDRQTKWNYYLPVVLRTRAVKIWV